MPERQVISKLATAGDEPRWTHPNGWVITRATRDWDMRGYRNTVGSDSPKRWYEIRPMYRSKVWPTEQFPLLRDARAWCDAHQYDAVTRQPVPRPDHTTTTRP